ncbi:MAG: T9SS type A sorting domain-containing protein [Bacteroidia bacterium]
MKKIIAIFSLSFICLIAFAQAPDKFYIKFGGSGNDFGYGLKETYDRQYIICGSTTTHGLGGSDAILLLIDSLGNPVWSKNYGGVLADAAKAIVVNPADSGFVFVGYSSSISNGGYDIYVVRTDKNGDMIWQKSIGTMDWDFGKSICLASDGNIVVCGTISNSIHGGKDALVAKLNINNGQTLWTRTLGGMKDDELNSIIFTSDNAVIASGYSKSYGDSLGDIWFVKLGSNGDSLVLNTIGYPSRMDYANDLAEDNANNIIICGALDTTGVSPYPTKSLILKTSLTGSVIGTYTVQGGGTPDDKFNSVAVNPNNNAYFLSRKVFQGVFDIITQPYLINDAFIWLASSTVGGFKYDEAFDVISTSDNGYALVGFTRSFEAQEEDIFFIKLDNGIYNPAEIIGIKENGMNEIANAQFYYFNHSLNWKNDQVKVFKVELYNLLGQKYTYNEIGTSNVELSTDLKSGIYIARFYDEQLNTIQQLKFVIENNK